MVPAGHGVLVGLAKIYGMLAVFYNYSGNSFFNEVIVVRAEEPSVRIVIIIEDVAALGGCSGFVVRFKAAFSAAKYDYVICEFGGADAQ